MNRTMVAKELAIGSDVGDMFGNNPMFRDMTQYNESEARKIIDMENLVKVRNTYDDFVKHRPDVLERLGIDSRTSLTVKNGYLYINGKKMSSLESFFSMAERAKRSPMASMNRTVIAAELVKIAKVLMSGDIDKTPYNLGYDAGDYMRRFEAEGVSSGLSIAEWHRKYGFAQQKKIFGDDPRHHNQNEWNRGYLDGKNGKPRLSFR